MVLQTVCGKQKRVADSATLKYSMFDEGEICYWRKKNPIKLSDRQSGWRRGRSGTAASSA
jgi:hypothetical protein